MIAEFVPHTLTPFVPKNGKAIGRCDGPASAVTSVGLWFDADGKPYPEHANIIGWFDVPDKPKEELKHYWIDQAQKMAKYFRYTGRP